MIKSYKPMAEDLKSILKYILTSLFCLLTIGTFGQSYKLFTADGELSSTLINQIYQDHNGMIWIATENGLNRYDGCKFVKYKNDPENAHSLQHNFVRTIFEDSQNHLFIGTYAGLQLYDPATDRFSLPIRWENGDKFTSSIMNIVERRNGELWVSGNDLVRINIRQEGITVQKIILPRPYEAGIVHYIHEDRHGNMWLCNRANKLLCLTTGNQIKSYSPINTGQPIISICEDNQGEIYVGTLSSGVFKYDRKHDCFTTLSGQTQTGLPVCTLYPSESGLYIGTDGKGVMQYTRQSGKIVPSRITNSDFDLSSAKIHSILKDNQGNYWFGIFQKGVIVIPAIPNNFGYIGHKSFNRDIIGSNCITTFCRDHEGVMWIGTDNDGIYAITENTHCKAHYRLTDHPEAIPPAICKLYEDSRKNLWVGTHTKGMGWIDRHTGQCSYWDKRLTGNQEIASSVYDFVEDRNGRVWIATMGTGLFYYDLQQNKLHSRQEREGEYINDWADCLLYSKDNKIYVGTYDGAFCVDLSTDEMKSSHITGSGYIIFSLYEDRQGIIWMGCSKGLLRWDPNSRKLQKFEPDAGSYDAIYAIQGDERNNLWISTNNGILQYNPKSGNTIHYYVGDGLQGNEFYKNASFQDTDGILWFGGMNGVNWFNPKDIINPAKKWDIRITGFYLHDQPVHKGVLSDGEEIIDCPVFEAREFRLGHNDNTFSIEFTTLGFNNPQSITYSYSLDNEPWFTLPAGSNRVTFSNLATGTHRFQVRAVDHALQSDISSITIRIAPAWHETWWAHLLAFLLLAGIAGLVILYLRHRYRIRQQMLEYIHAKEIDEAKFQFFVNISHEIRTPMSLIINPLFKLMHQDTDESRQAIYQTIYRNAERILRLINQLMDMRKIEKGQMTLRFQETEIIHTIDELCQTFTPAVREKDITLLFHHEGMEQLTLWVSPDYFEKIIINILSNALKFTPKNGQIDISIERKEDSTPGTPLPHYVEITVADNGPGIHPSEIERIFQRFYQAGHSSANGTGIGLHLTRSLVQLHHGTIHAENNPDGAGCRFIIRIPEGDGHLRPEEMEHGDTPSDNNAPQPATPALSETEPTSKKPTYARTKYKVLIVEDNTEIRNYIRQELSTDYHTAESGNGKEALEKIFSIHPDLVISDIMMPEMDGMELCRRIKQNINLNHIPVILLTAKVRETDNIEGLKMGADAYITKPFNMEVLRETAKNLILGRERLRNTFNNNQTQEKKQKKIEAPSADEKLLERIMTVINQNLDNPDLSVKMITEAVGISRVHLHRKLKELTNQSTSDFIRNVRLQQAARLMKEKKYSINEVARLTGFPDPNYFSTVFKNLYGVPPSTYMNEHN